jgi:hypothetical protein
MSDQVWILAKLSQDQLELVHEAERTLGPFQLLVFKPAELPLGKLNESQLECLRGLEKNLGMTVLAYVKE